MTNHQTEEFSLFSVVLDLSCIARGRRRRLISSHFLSLSLSLSPSPPEFSFSISLPKRVSWMWDSSILLFTSSRAIFWVSPPTDWKGRRKIRYNLSFNKRERRKPPFSNTALKLLRGVGGEGEEKRKRGRESVGVMGEGEGKEKQVRLFLYRRKEGRKRLLLLQVEQRDSLQLPSRPTTLSFPYLLRRREKRANLTLRATFFSRNIKTSKTQPPLHGSAESRT